MTEKLLTKPPFRYLHDIFTATMGKTGFGDGLFQGDELNSKSFEDRNSKLQFLVKIITLTEMIIQEKIDIKPNLVLAGQEPEKTNLWLQMMFRAATSQIDTTPYVQEILGVGGQDEGEGDDGQAEAQAQAEAEAAQAQAQAQAEQEARQAAEEENKRKGDMEKAERKKKMEEKKKKQKQAEEEER